MNGKDTLKSILKYTVYGAGVGLFGQYVAPICSTAAANAAAATAGHPVVLACALGAAVVAIPYFILNWGLNKIFEDDTNCTAYFVLDAMLKIGAMYAAGFVGAMILGITAAPLIATCAAIGSFALIVTESILKLACCCLTIGSAAEGIANHQVNDQEQRLAM